MGWPEAARARVVHLRVAAAGDDDRGDGEAGINRQDRELLTGRAASEEELDHPRRDLGGASRTTGAADEHRTTITYRLCRHQCAAKRERGDGNAAGKPNEEAGGTHGGAQ